MRAGACLALVVMAYVTGTSRGSPCLDLSAPREPSLVRLPPRRSCVVHLARVLSVLLMKMGRTRPLVDPRREPQAGKSGDPRSQNADTRVGERGNFKNFLRTRKIHLGDA